MDDFQLDGRRWRFLNNPAQYIKLESSARESNKLQIAPLTRQFKTAKEILTRLTSRGGVLLADDVGLGKTTVGALVAWAAACQGKRVRIYAPNEVLRRRWAEELERHVPMLQRHGAHNERIKQGDIEKLKAGRIQVTTHYALVKSHGNNQQRTACDLMIIDEAHRAKGEGSAFNEALRNLGNRAKRKLILTATPFSIRPTELEQLLQFVGSTKFTAIQYYADELKRLYSLGEGHDITTESKRLVSAATKAINDLEHYVIRHGINDLSEEEKRHFGEVAQKHWEIQATPATREDLSLLLRMDRLLQLAPERKGDRRNDPRFHTGWQHVGTELERASERATDPIALKHIEAAKKTLELRRTKPHPKITAVSDAIYPLLNINEKVLIFCHHHATASELLSELEFSLQTAKTSPTGPPEKIWREAWQELSKDWSELGLTGTNKDVDKDFDKKKAENEHLLLPIIDWLCTAGIRSQVSGWIGEPKSVVRDLMLQIRKSRPRNQKADVPTILEAAKTLTKALLDQQSTSTRKLLKNIAEKTHTFGGNISQFPGRLDDGFRVMGAWHHNGHGTPPKTLYTGKPDIVLALFNSPFGPDVLVTTDRLSEGVDLHRCCRHLIHYELDPSPVRTLQRNGRVRRVGSWAALTGQPIQYAYPTFQGTRDEKATSVMQRRLNAFDLLLGGVPSLGDDTSDSEQSFADAVLRRAGMELKSLNRKLTVTSAV